MAFTGTPVVKAVSESLVRITGISLAPGASGTISLFTGAGDIKCPDDFAPTKYVADGAVVSLQESIEISHLPCVPIQIVKTSGATEADFLATLTNLNTAVANAPINVSNVVTNPTISGGAVVDSAMFYGTTAGTGSAGNDYAATVAVGAPVPFPRLGPASAGTAIIPGGTNQFVLPVTGIYRVSWAVDFLEASQLEIALNGTPVANTCATSGAGTQQNTNTVLVSATAGDLLSIINPAGNAAALTVQTADGSLTHAQAPSLTIERLGSGGAITASGTAVASTATGGAVSAPAATGPLEIYIRHH